MRKPIRVLCSVAMVFALAVISACGVENDADLDTADLDLAAALNLNSASAVELARLPGLGLALGNAIVADRQANGPFFQVADMKRVRGVGAKIYEKARRKLTVGTRCDMGVTECGAGTACVSDDDTTRAVCLTATKCASDIGYLCGGSSCVACATTPSACDATADCGADQVCPQILCITTPCISHCQQGGWAYTLPKQCGTNAWQEDMARNPEAYTECQIRAMDPLPENCQIRKYFSRQGITVHDIQRSTYAQMVCMSCSCIRGDRVDLLVAEWDVERLVSEHGFTAR